MGQGRMTSPAADVPVPNMPPGAHEVRGMSFGMQGNASAVGVGNLVGGAGDLVGAGSLANTGGLVGAGNLAGRFGAAGDLSGTPNAGSCPYPQMTRMMSGPFNPEGKVSIWFGWLWTKFTNEF